MLNLYYAPGTIALASLITLHEAGAEFELTLVDFSKETQKSASYLKINPKARVPALLTDNGILTETPAMLAYIAQIYPDANLALLNDPFAFAQIQSFNSYIASTLHVNHAHRKRGNRWVDDEAAIKAMQKKAPETVANSFDHLEKDVFQGPYVMGDNYTIADPYLFTVARWMEGDGVDINGFPKIKAHYTLMETRPAVVAALKDQKGS